ncbi:MAG: FAD-binding protein [Actinomycetota bacterium]
MNIKVLKDKCTGCKLCQKACFYDAVDMKGKLAYINENCILCGACVEACKFDAIEMKEQAPDIDFSAYSGVMVYLETSKGGISDSGFELLSEAYKLKNDLGTPLSAAVIGNIGKGALKEAFRYGADKVYAASSSVFDISFDDIYSKVLVRLIKEKKPEIFLAAATPFGRTLVPKVAAILKTGLTADCTRLKIDPESKLLKQTRPTFGGNVLATIVCKKSRPQMATVRPHVMEKKEVNGIGSKDIEEIEIKEAGYSSSYRLVEMDKKVDENINLADYEVIVSGGRGLGQSKNFSLLKDLADLLGGALGASRAAVDSGWISYPHQVGQTGKTVNPKIYIACGISGAIQHLAGMQTSDIIIAINKDESAPIFKVANYGIVGDLFEVVPKLISRIKNGKPLID